MTLCLTPHPTRSEVACDKSEPCFGFHANALANESWPGNPLPVREETKEKASTRKGRLATIAQRASR